MTQLSVHIEPLKNRAADPRVSRLLPSALVIGGALAAALISATFVSPQARSMGGTAAPKLPPIGIIGASAPETTRVAAPASKITGQTSFAFGFLEFDWDPNAPGGVPGFDSWPKQ